VEAAPSRKQSFASYEHLALRWQPSQTGDRVFAISAAIALVLALLLGAVMSSIEVPKKTQRERAAVPERVAQFLRQQLPKPPPPPPPEPKLRPPEPKPVEPKPEVAQQPVRVERERPRPQQPLTEQQQQTRDVAQRSGLLAHMSELHDLMDTPEVSAQVKRDLKTTEAAQVARHDTQALTSNATAVRGSGGVDASQYATRAGSATLTAAEVATTRAALDASAEAFAKTDTSARNDNRRARSEEEVTLVFDRHKSQLQGIYNRARRSNPALKGKLVLAVTIEPNGSVSGVKVVSSELKDQALVDSLLARIRNFQFGASDVERVTVNYPIEFLPY
jgi:protein TonB